MSFIKYILGGLVLLVSSIAVYAAPYITPQQCLATAQTIHQIASLRDAGMPREVLDEQVAQLDGIERQFWSYWVPLIFNSKEKPDTIGMSFYTACIAEQGDLAKLYGKVA